MRNALEFLFKNSAEVKVEVINVNNVNFLPTSITSSKNQATSVFKPMAYLLGTKGSFFVGR